jgi:hypothetical protein
VRPVAASRDHHDARIPVWVALSALYLDTEVSACHDAIAATLAASPYSLDELHPALYPNLLSVAGEWAGFDDAWLVERILDVRRRPRWRRRISRWFARDIGDHWRTLSPMIRSARSAEPQR